MDKEAICGTLYLVGTPIGNLKDLSFRALETLQQVDIIAAEDTRHTQKLLNHYNINKKLTSYHEHNKKSKGQYIIEILLAGKNVALVSDAGMPGISDPGADLVKECINNNITMTVIPGASALISGLVLSGIDTAAFVFQGFLPREKKDRKKILESLSRESRTIIIYESPFRIIDTLKEIKILWGERYCCVSRELTKIHEEIRRGTISDVLASYEENNIKGEITLIIEGKIEQDHSPPSWEVIEEMYYERLTKGYTRKEAVKETALYYGVSRRELYNKVIKDQ